MGITSRHDVKCARTLMLQERSRSRTRERFELAGNLHASMIVENVDPAMSIVDPRDQPLECAVVGHIEPFPIRFATLALNPLGGFRRPLPVAVRRDHIGPFARHDFGAGPANA